MDEASKIKYIYIYIKQIVFLQCFIYNVEDFLATGFKMQKDSYAVLTQPSPTRVVWMQEPKGCG